VLDLLHQVLVAWPKDPADGGHAELEDDDDGKADEAVEPPGQRAAEVVQEGVADDVRPRKGLVDGGEEDVPEEPPADGEDEADGRDDCLVVVLEDAEGVWLVGSDDECECL